MVKTWIPLILKIDMQWLLRGHLSPSGTIHAIGAVTNRIIGTQLLINTYIVCKKYESVFNKLEDARKKCECINNQCYHCIDVIKTKHQIKGIQDKITKISSVCTKKMCPSDKSCGCKKIGPTKSKTTRLTKLTRNCLFELNNNKKTTY